MRQRAFCASQLTVNRVHHLLLGGGGRRRRPGGLLVLIVEGVVHAALGPALERLQLPGAAQRPVQELGLGGDPVLLLLALPDLFLEVQELSNLGFV